MIWTKGAHRSAKFQTFERSHKISPNLYFDRLPKVYKTLAKIEVQRSYSLNPEDWCKIWRKTDLLFQKWQEFGEIWPEHSKASKTCPFICFYCAKYLMFDLKKYRGVIFHDTERWCKIWRKTDLWFGKWHEEHGKFSSEHLKVLRLWWDSLIQSRKSMSLKFTAELCVMTMKNDAKFEEELTCRFKMDMRNLTNLDPSTWKSQIFNFNVLLLSKVYIFELKKYRGVIFHDTEKRYKIWRGIDLSFQNWHKAFDKFWPEHSKVLKNSTLMGSFWAKYMLLKLNKYRGVIFQDI